MRRFFVLSLGLASLVSGLVACSYIFESTVPDSDVLPTITQDANNVTDGQAEDVAPVSDASPFDAAIPFCASQTPAPVFCADFDDDPPAALDSFGTTEAVSGALSIANTISRSPSRSLLSSVTAGSASTAALVHPLGSSPSEVTLSTSILVTSWSPTEARLATLRLTDGGPTTCLVWLGTSAKSYVVTERCTTNDVETGKLTTDTARPVELRKWLHVRMALKLAPQKTLTVDLDDVRVVDVAALDAITAAPVSAVFGIQSAAGGAGVVFEDNLLVTSP